MAGVHMLIGVGEAAITALVLVAVGQAHPELLYAPGRSAEERTGYRTLTGYGLVCGGGAGVVSVAVRQQAARRFGPCGRNARLCRIGAPFVGRAYAAGELSAARHLFTCAGHRAGRVAGDGDGVLPGKMGVKTTRSA